MVRLFQSGAPLAVNRTQQQTSRVPVSNVLLCRGLDGNGDPFAVDGGGVTGQGFLGGAGHYGAIASLEDGAVAGAFEVFAVWGHLAASVGADVRVGHDGGFVGAEQHDFNVPGRGCSGTTDGEFAQLADLVGGAAGGNFSRGFALAADVAGRRRAAHQG